MTLYEYECNGCGQRLLHRFKMGEAAPWVWCPDCPNVLAYRVFSITCIKTDTNNPLRCFGRRLGADMSTRNDVERVFQARGLVMASDRECDATERDNRTEQRQLDKVVADTVREYNALPARLKKADAAKVAKEEAARPNVPATPLQT